MIEGVGVGLGHFLGEQNYVARYDGTAVNQPTVIEGNRPFILERVPDGKTSVWL